MDNENLKALAEEVGEYVRDQVSGIQDRLADLASDVAAIPEARDGVDGERGEKGDPGDSITGPQGERGEVGPEGPPGPVGPAGESIQGEKGEKGDAGESIIGPEGAPGPAGKDGESIQGEPGQQGERGEKGDQGEAGTGIDVPQWVEGVYREGSEVQHHFGQFFRALSDTAESPDDLESWERVGSAGFRLTGSYAKDFEYRDGDLFVKDFGLFLHKGGESVCIAGRGPQGQKGKPGSAGRDGQPGADGSDGKDGSSIEALELRGANLVAVFKDADGEVKDHAVSLEPFLKTAALVTKEAHTQNSKAMIEEADTYVRKLFEELNNHLDDDSATPINFYRGLWKADVRYQVGDWVRFGTEGFLCKQACLGVMPKNYPNQQQMAGDYWQAVSGLPTHGAGVDGDNTGGGGVITDGQLTKEGTQGGTKFSQFASTSGEGITGVGIQGGKNVKFELTTDAIAVNPNPFRNAKNGQFAATPKELENIKNQRDVNEFLYERIVDIEAGDIEIPPGTIVSDTPPADPEEGQGWYDTGRLELFVYANDGWFPCSPLGARIEEGEIVQAQILERLETGESRQETIATEIVHALGEQSAIEGRVKVGEGVQQEIKSDLVTLENKVKQIEGAVGEHTINFTQSNQTPRHGEFNLLDDGMQMVYQIEEAAHIQISNVDADGSPVAIDRVGVGDVIRLAHGMTGMAELRVTSASDGFFSVTKINGDLNEMFVGPYGFVMLSQYDPAGIATIAYVDQQDEILRQDTLTLNAYFERVTLKNEGTNQLPDETDWKLKQETGGSNKTLLQVQNGQLGLYNLKTPTSGHHATSKSYVDNEMARKFAELQDRLDAPPGQPFTYQSGSSGMSEKCFQYYNSDSRNKIRISTKSLNVDWASQNISGDRFWEGESGPLFFTIWHYPALGANETRRNWKQRAHGSIDRIDWHVADLVCYIKAHHTKESFTPDATYYITIGGVL